MKSLTREKDILETVFNTIQGAVQEARDTGSSVLKEVEIFRPAYNTCMLQLPHSEQIFIAEVIGLSAIVGAFLAGAVFKEDLKFKNSKNLAVKLQ